MNALLLGLVIFFAVHSVSIVSDPWRNRMAARMGEWTWQGVYALVSIAGFVLIVWGYGLARQDPVVLYTPPAWLHPVAMVLLVPVFPLLLAAYLPGRIQAAAQHPMLVATKLWAVAHLLANGMLADVLLFGAFLVWAVLDRISMKHRTQRAIPGPPLSRANDIIAVIGGLALYAAFVLWLHGWLIGTPLIERT
ncbi:MAG TPA: NnrU family protein [Thiobacillus sp.]|nr:NnrU family protein [Thiobacillus sp.]